MSAPRGNRKHGVYSRTSSPSRKYQPAAKSVSSLRVPRSFAKISKLFRVDIERLSDDRTILESDMIKQYTLENPAKRFEALMKDGAYAADVWELLKERHPHRAYLITGFLTTTNSSWESNRLLGVSQTISATVPVAEALGAPIPVLDLGVGISYDSKTKHQSSRTAEKKRYSPWHITLCS